MREFLANFKDEDISNIKNLNAQELNKLAGQIRSEIINVVSKNGGHLASSLGAVDLCIALHYVFDLSKDSIVWDVGHQAYAHKLLTGRGPRFSTLRKLNGISGFPSKFESKYDPFLVGHGSTAISSALGMITARTLSNKEGEIIVVVGDGSLQGGMAFEALNQVSYLNEKIIVILNDNEMSISPTVGAISSYLSRVITNPIYNEIKGDLENLFKKIPRLGEPALKAAKRLEETLKNFLVPGIIFEELGFTYLGPIDGHNISSLIDILKRARNFKEPLFIHVVTKKGKGYRFAEEEPSRFHSAKPFDIATGKNIKTKSSLATFTSTFTDKIIELSQKNKRVVGITAAMPGGTGLSKFSKIFPNRFFNVGMAEQHGVTFAAGLANEGYIPIIAIYSTFLQRAYDQVVHDVCLQDLHVIFAIDRSGLVGEDGPTHHGIFDLAYLRHLPNMNVMAPKSTEELKAMLEFAVDFKHPIVIRYPKGSPIWYKEEFAKLDKKNSEILHGKSEILLEGSDVAIISLGSMVYPSLIAAEKLADIGIEPTVINARFIKPLDKELLNSVFDNYKFLVTIEEGCLKGGFGSAVLEYISECSKNTKIMRLGIPDEFIKHGDRLFLLDELNLSPQGIFEQVKKLCRK